MKESTTLGQCVTAGRTKRTRDRERGIEWWVWLGIEWRYIGWRRRWRRYWWLKSDSELVEEVEGPGWQTTAFCVYPETPLRLTLLLTSYWYAPLCPPRTCSFWIISKRNIVIDFNKMTGTLSSSLILYQSQGRSGFPWPPEVASKKCSIVNSFN